MAHQRYKLPYKRKARGKTDYRKRLKLLTSKLPRLVIQPSNKNMRIVLIRYERGGDTVVVGVASSILTKKYGWKLNKGNIPSAYLLGFLAGKRIKEQGIKKAILDTRFSSSTKGSKIYAAVQGVVDAGIDVPHKQDMLPDKEKVSGKAIEAYAAMLEKSSADAYKERFSAYLKKNIDPKNASKYFDETKKKILAG